MGANFLSKSRHDTIFYFRRRVPLALQTIIGKPTIVFSLKTPCKRTAIILARKLAVQTDGIFYRLRSMADSKERGQINLIMTIDVGELGKPNKVVIDAEPHEKELADALLSTVMHVSQVGSRLSNGPDNLPPNPFESGLDRYKAESNQKASSLATHNSKFNHAKSYFGQDTDIHSINQFKFSAYCAHVKNTIGHSVTQGHYMQTISSFINWHLTRAGLPLTSTKTFIPKRLTPESDDRDAFSIADLEALFKNAHSYHAKQPHKYWVTIALAFLGCRLEELAQVNLNSDLGFDEEHNIWYFKFDEIADASGDKRKSLKVASSWRHIPIHSWLVRNGFIDYLLEQKHKGFTRPFENAWKPNITNRDTVMTHKWSHAISKWGGREKDHLINRGMLKSMKVSYFHSMRHTFSGIMGDAGVNPEIVEALCGRKYGGSDQERYAKLKKNYMRLSKEGIEVGLSPLINLLDKITNPLNQ